MSENASPADGGMARVEIVGEEGCTLYLPCRPARVDAGTWGLHFDTSPEVMQRLRDALARPLEQP